MEQVIVSSKIPLSLIIEYKGKQVTLNGSNTALIPEYGIGTTEVDKSFMDAWLDANKDQPYVKSGAIWVSSNAKNAKAEAKEKTGLKTGTERIDKKELDKIKEKQNKGM